MADDKKDEDIKKDDKDDDDGSIHIDPETYRAYQSAYAAAEQNVMEDKVKAGQDSCGAIMKLTMVCLLVAKLEQSYEAIEERETEGDDVDVDVGFNTLWLIFPLFVIAGFMIFCCACLIYSAPDPDELMNKDDDEATTWQIDYMYDIGLIIGGGTSQIQKNIIGERGLGLPREPKVQAAAR